MSSLKIREGHTELDAIAVAPRQALVAEVEAARRLDSRARCSAAVGRRLVEEGSDEDLCALAEVSECVCISFLGRLAERVALESTGRLVSLIFSWQGFRAWNCVPSRME